MPIGTNAFLPWILKIETELTLKLNNCEGKFTLLISPRNDKIQTDRFHQVLFSCFILLIN